MEPADMEMVKAEVKVEVDMSEDDWSTKENNSPAPSTRPIRAASRRVRAITQALMPKTSPSHHHRTDSSRLKTSTPKDPPPPQNSEDRAPSPHVTQGTEPHVADDASWQQQGTVRAPQPACVADGSTLAMILEELRTLRSEVAQVKAHLPHVQATVSSVLSPACVSAPPTSAGLSAVWSSSSERSSCLCQGQEVPCTEVNLTESYITAGHSAANAMETGDWAKKERDPTSQISCTSERPATAESTLEHLQTSHRDSEPPDFLRSQKTELNVLGSDSEQERDWAASSMEETVACLPTETEKKPAVIDLTSEGSSDQSTKSNRDSIYNAELVTVDVVDEDSDLDMDLDGLQAEFEDQSDSDTEEYDRASDTDSSGDSEESDASRSQNSWSFRLSPVSEEEFKEDVGVFHDLDVGASAVDYFQLFFSDDVFDMIAKQTNLYAEQMQAKKGFDSAWHPTNMAEVKVYLAINIMMGIHVLPTTASYWSKDDRLNVPCISRMMSSNRFMKIHQYVHLNDDTQSVPLRRPGHDPLFEVRPLLDTITQRYSSLFIPGRHISIDEMIIKFKGRLWFKQPMRSDPRTQGIKLWCCADPATGYLLNFSVYTGKEPQQRKGNLGHHVVMSVAKNYLDKGHYFYFNEFFTSVQLAADLHGRRTRCCGLISMNQKGWPEELNFGKIKGLRQQKLAAGTVKMRQKGDMVATVWQDRQTVAVLSTHVQPQMGTSLCSNGKGGQEERDVPQAIITFIKNRGGVHHHNQQRSYYPISRPHKNWWPSLFWFCVQSSLVNAHILYKKTSQPAPRSDKLQEALGFRLAVFEGLVAGARLRAEPSNAQPTMIGRVVNDLSQHPVARMPGRAKTCMHCRKNKQLTPRGQPRETVWGCPLCKVNLCKGLCFAQFHVRLWQ